MTYTQKCNQKCYLHTHITVAFNFLFCVTSQQVLGIMLAFRHSFPLSFFLPCQSVHVFCVYSVYLSSVVAQLI